MSAKSSAKPGTLAPLTYRADGVPGLEVSEARWSDWDAAVAQCPGTDRVHVRGEKPPAPRLGDYWLRSILASARL